MDNAEGVQRTQHSSEFLARSTGFLALLNQFNKMLLIVKLADQKGPNKKCIVRIYIRVHINIGSKVFLPSSQIFSNKSAKVNHIIEVHLSNLDSLTKGVAVVCFAKNSW